MKSKINQKRNNRYRTKPLEVAAIRFDGTIKSIAEIFKKLNISSPWWTEHNVLYIHEAGHIIKAKPGDWIIRNLSGEFEVCKPDIFAQTYEPVQDDGQVTGA